MPLLQLLLFRITPVLFSACLMAISGHSYALAVGDKLPTVEIKKLGLIIVDDEKGKNARYQAWSSKSLQGKKWVVQHISPRLKIGSLNNHLNDAIKALEYPDSCRTVSIINLGDALFGTYLIAKSEAKKGLLRNIKCTVVSDKKNIARKAWGIKKKRNITMVINEAGIIEFYHDGKLSDEQVQQIISMTNAQT